MPFVFKCMPNCGLCCRLSPVTVLPHEVYLIQDEAEELGVEVKFRTGYTVVDLNNKVILALSYLMLLNDENKCPFLSNNKCLVHDKYKPLTCRAYPYLPRIIRYSIDRLNKVIDFEVKYAASTICPVVKQGLSNGILIKLSSDLNLASQVFVNEFPAALEMVEARKIYSSYLSYLWRIGEVDLREDDGTYNYPIVNSFWFIRRYYPNLTVNEVVNMSKMNKRNNINIGV
ncbi:YkgJ family cysteine cluster protein [Caldivirga sp. UBA161]|uniref:YkgJ family cysteine cluster protein n=1 Tax=Caldivirga sp. UBA161 TaxID=1915569 RepID=UPI0025C0B9B7|nr:YkgJ family cysteine cluster protein [Caldivirga sp. UBA161]